MSHKTLLLWSQLRSQLCYDEPKYFDIATTIVIVECYLKAWRGGTDLVRLNADGSSLTNSEKTGFDAICKDHSGKFILGFDGNVGESNILQAERMALLHGILLCWEEGF